jgi:hypothetical protein
LKLRANAVNVRAALSLLLMAAGAASACILSLGKEKQGDNDMTKLERNTNSPDVLFRPASHYDSPEDILHDGELSVAEKRVILSSWASDMYTIESCPWLRKVPGVTQPVRLSDILAALQELDPGGDDDPPRPGASAMRVVPLTRLKALRRRGRELWLATNRRVARST